MLLTHDFKLSPSKQSAHPLQKEFQVFQENLQTWLADHPGEFVLIKGQRVIDFFHSEREALGTGLNMFPGQPIFVHEIRQQIVYKIATVLVAP